MLSGGRWIAVCAATLALAGCGSSGGSDSAGTGASAGTSGSDVKQRAGDLLDRWSNQPLPALVTMRARAQAAAHGDAAKAETLDRKAMRQIRPVEKWGRDARELFIDDP